MKGINIIVKDELKQELKQFAKEVCVGAASYTRDALTDAAYEAFERFYCDYTPIPGGVYTSYHFKFAVPQGVPMFYDRTYNVLENGIDKYYENKHGKIIQGGVEINPEWLKDYYNFDTTFVFQSIYEEGAHGFGGGIKPMNPTPEELLERNFRSLYNNIGVAVGVGVSKAKKLPYNYLHW